MNCPECGETMVTYEKVDRLWYDCPRCGYDFCDDDDYTHEGDEELCQS